MEDLVGDIQFGGHIQQRGVGRTVLDNIDSFLVSEVLDGIVDLVLNRLDECLAFLVQLTFLSEILAFELEYLLLFLDYLLLALRPHGLAEEDLLCLVVCCHDTRFLLRGVHLFLPALGEHGQLLIRLLILRQVFEDILQVDIRYRLIFSKSRAKSEHGGKKYY